MDDLKGKKVLVVGLGVSGLAAAKFLAGKGAAVKVTDSADNERVQSYREALSRLWTRHFRMPKKGPALNKACPEFPAVKERAAREKARVKA